VQVEEPRGVARLTRVKWRFFALVSLSVVALVAAAQSSGQTRTTAPPPVVSIRIMITDSAIQVTPKRAQRGTMARFILVNSGKKPHVFTLGHQQHGTARQTGFTKALAPSQQSVLILFLDYRGVIPYHGSLPADRTKPRMKGIFTII
jgi:hypothetical protein